MGRKKKVVKKHDLENIVIPKRLRKQMSRRVEVAEMLLAGYSYVAITDKMHCSTAFISGVAKRLKAEGLIKK